MRIFKDTVTGTYYQFLDSDDVRQIDGIWFVFDVNGVQATLPHTLEPAELPPTPGPQPPTLEQVQAQRLSAYQAESDPLKIEAEYDALRNGWPPDYTAWIAKVEEIKARYPVKEGT